MPNLGILEGRMLAGARQHGLFGGTLASSRTRKSVGPTLFGARVLDPEGMISTIQAQAVAAGLSAQIGASIGTRAVSAQYADQPFNVAAEIQAALSQARLSANAGAAAGRGRAADAMYNQAKAAALAAGLSASVAESIAMAAGQATAAGLSYNVAAAISASRLTATPVTYAPSPDPTASTPLPVLATQEQLRQYYESPSASAPVADTNAPPPAASTSPEDILRHTFNDTAPAASAAPAAKSFLVPVAALAAAYFFLKG